MPAASFLRPSEIAWTDPFEEIYQSRRPKNIGPGPDLPLLPDPSGIRRMSGRVPGLGLNFFEERDPYCFISQIGITEK